MSHAMRAAVIKALDPVPHTLPQIPSHAPRARVTLWGPAPRVAAAPDQNEVRIRRAKDVVRLTLLAWLDVLHTNRRLASRLSSAITDAPYGSTASTEFVQVDGARTKVAWTAAQLRDAPAEWERLLADQAGLIRSLAVRALVLDAVTPEMYAAIVQSLDAPASAPNAPVVNVNVAPAEVTFGADSIKVDAPVKVDAPITVSPVIETGGGERDFVFDHSGKPTGIRRVDKVR